MGLAQGLNPALSRCGALYEETMNMLLWDFKYIIMVSNFPKVAECGSLLEID